MRVFESFNQSPDGEPCPVCKTKKDCETVLVPVSGTEIDGIVEAKQVHKKCYDLILDMGGKLVL